MGLLYRVNLLTASGGVSACEAAALACERALALEGLAGRVFGEVRKLVQKASKVNQHNSHCTCQAWWLPGKFVGTNQAVQRVR